MKWFKSRDQKTKELIKETLKAKPINSQDLDLARLDKMAAMVARMQQSQPQTSSGNFMQDMMQFEQFKGAMATLEEAKIEKLREKIESEYQDSDDGMNPDQIMKVLGGFLGKKEPETEPFPMNPMIQAPNPTPSVPVDLPDLPDLNPIEKSAVTLAVKKMPKMAKNAFKTLSEDKKQAVINSMLDRIEQE